MLLKASVEEKLLHVGGEDALVAFDKKSERRREGQSDVNLPRNSLEFWKTLLDQK